MITIALALAFVITMIFAIWGVYLLLVPIFGATGSLIIALIVGVLVGFLVVQ